MTSIQEPPHVPETETLPICHAFVRMTKRSFKKNNTPSTFLQSCALPAIVGIIKLPRFFAWDEGLRRGRFDLTNLPAAQRPLPHVAVSETLY